MKESEILIIYKGKDGQSVIQVKLKNETIWLSQRQMAELFIKEN